MTYAGRVRDDAWVGGAALTVGVYSPAVAVATTGVFGVSGCIGLILSAIVTHVVVTAWFDSRP